jgi:hypothetical protein
VGDALADEMRPRIGRQVSQFVGITQTITKGQWLNWNHSKTQRIEPPQEKKALDEERE